MINKILDLIRSKNIAILGFGREGRSSYDFIRNHLPFKHITIIDKENVLETNSDLKDDDYISVVYGDDYLNNLGKYDLILKTPGVSLIDVDDGSLKDKITSQLELLLEVQRDRVIGITGTKGKSTTTSLAYQVLKNSGLKCVICGNIGIPAFSLIEDVDDDTYFVIEMSSHQLEYLKVSPHVGVVLNLFQDHLDHAGSVEEYHNSKMKMFRYQKKRDYMIYFKDNETLNEKVKENSFNGKEITISLTDDASVSLKGNDVYYKDKKVFSKDIERNLLGEHNFINIMFVYAIAKIFKVSDKVFLETVKNFKSLEYRLEHFATIKDVKYYVDTLATIPEATLEAINAIPDINTLIFGGMDRGISYEGFAEKLAESNVEHFICMPKTGYVIAKELPKDRVYLAETLEEAAKLAKKITKKGTSCILSPAAASYEYFKNYQEKGDKFKEYINKK